MHPPGARTVVVRTAELGVKSDQVRIRMEQRLRDNIAALLADRDVPGDVTNERNRLYVESDAVEAAADAAADAFGVASASPAVRTEPTMAALREVTAEAAAACHEGGPFAVDASRAGGPDAHPFSSPDIERECGAAVGEAIEAAGRTATVDLDDPSFTVHVECRPEKAFVFVEKRSGPGGLPLGTQAPLVALVSGGHDSPVAAYEAMRRGSPVIPLYVDLGEYGGADHHARASAAAERLAAFAPGYDLGLRVAPAGELVADLAAETGETRMLSVRRAMLALADAVAREHEAAGIVTGEVIGQKSSQTAANIAVTDAAADLPVHRPLVTTDKSDIVERAREIGTFGASSIPAGCDRVAPSLPETDASLSAVEAAEPDDLLERARALATRVE